MCKRVLCLTILCVFGWTAAASAADLVGHWKLDEQTGTTASDSSGKGNHGTWGGNPTVVVGVFGNALAFADSRVTIPASASLSADLFQGSFTLTAWINPARTGNTWQQIFRAVRTDNASNDTLFLNNDGRLSWRGRVATAWAGGMCETAAGVVPANDWSHVAVVGDGTNFRIYVNGAVSQTSAFRKTDGGNATYYIGGTSGGESYTGMVDDLRVYSGMLTEAEILQTAFRPKARKPDPADGAVGVSTPLLQWTKGDSAIFHNVYFGTSPELMETNLAAKNQPFAMYFHVPGLQPGVTYYWRVDEIEADMTTAHTGDVWSFTSTPLTAFVPGPTDGTTGLFPSQKLSWRPGQGATKHQVYFSNLLADVTSGTPAADKGQVTETAFNTGVLRSSTTYYWRVDEVQADGTASPGPVWSFTTSDGVAKKVMRQWWTGITGTAVNLLTGNAQYPNNPTGSELLDTFEGPTGWNNNYGSRLYGWLIPPQSGDYIFWIASDDSSELRLSTDADPANVKTIASVSGWTNSRQWDKYPTQKSAAVKLEAGKKYYLEAVMKEGTGGDNVAVSWQGPGIATQEIIKGDYVDSFALPALAAFLPAPANGTVDVIQAPVLNWNTGEKAQKHDVYLGDDQAAVAAADSKSPLYQGQQADATFTAGELEWNKTYYWRVDEINAGEAESPWKGPVWSFTTRNYVLVDDMESYNDDIDAKTTIFDTWIDGLTDGKSNSVVGNTQAPFAERAIVHGGQQSMPLDYNNTKTPFFSEAVQTFSPLQDWTVKDVNALSLWFRGRPVPFVDKGNDAFTVGASGHDIWDNADDFRFVYKRLNGDGSVIVNVESLVNTNGWAKAGVMIRESLDAGSPMAYMIQSVSNGVSFGWRQTAGSTCGSRTQGGIRAPQWVKLTRKGNAFTAQYSADGKAWTDIKNADGTVTTTNIMMTGNIYIGLAVTSHNSGATTTAEFSGAATTGGVSGPWQVAWIGDDPDRTNGTAGLYLTVEDSAGKSVTVPHSDPAAVNLDAWTQWKIPLSSLTGVDLAKVKKVYIGVGDKKASAPDGAGRIYVDDIRVIRP